MARAARRAHGRRGQSRPSTPAWRPLPLLVRERPFVEGIYAPGATPEETTALANRLGLAEGRRLDIAELRLRMGESDAPNVEYEIIPKRDNKTDVCIYRK